MAPTLADGWEDVYDGAQCPNCNGHGGVQIGEEKDGTPIADMCEQCMGTGRIPALETKKKGQP